MGECYHYSSQVIWNDFGEERVRLKVGRLLEREASAEQGGGHQGPANQDQGHERTSGRKMEAKYSAKQFATSMEKLVGIILAMDIAINTSWDVTICLHN